MELLDETAAYDCWRAYAAMAGRAPQEERGFLMQKSASVPSAASLA